MLDSVHTGAENEGGSDDYPIELKGISNFEMESFLDANSARFFSEECTFNWKQLAAALHLSTMWAFDDLRSRLIKHMEKDIGTVDPLDRVDVALQCRVEAWLHPAYKDVCERSTKLTAAEGERLGMARFSAICRVIHVAITNPAGEVLLRACIAVGALPTERGTQKLEQFQIGTWTCSP
ncbi:hypothetical protein FRC04_002161 [Tulasnella sp. 424]|nr:hypothetical protein FRC04_002161 [Tulasnella sp. 424]KAG8967803.1 hypothetical protein FRC05_001899 [Tulasnella sp. 425]